MDKIRYITLPVGYKLYNKSETKLEIADLFAEPVLVTVTTTDVDKFSSVRVYVCSIEPTDIQSNSLIYLDEVS